MDTLTRSLRSYTQGATLPQAFYIDRSIFNADLQRIFYSNWLFAGHSCDIPNPGDYFTLKIGDESVIVTRDQEGQLHAHFNVCRHRGSKIVLDECGQTKTFVCPYHQWAYRPDGELVGARLMGPDFDKSCYSLISAHVRELAGLLFICLASVPPDFEAAIAEIAPQLHPHRLDKAKVICRDRYTVKANWKTVLENNRECYHCQGTHPEFTLSNYDLGLPGDSRCDHTFAQKLADSYRHWEAMGLCPREVNFPNGSWFRVSRYPLKEGFLTESLDGQLTAPLMGVCEPDVGSLRLIGLPNFWAHANADYAMTTRVVPLGPGLTQIDVAFLVHEAAVEEIDYEIDKVAAVWRATSKQDWQLCENNYAGVCSSAYSPGPLSPLAEKSIEGFYTWYSQQLQRQHLAVA